MEGYWIRVLQIIKDLFNSWRLYLFHKIDIKKHNYIKPEFYFLFKESLALSCHIIVADWSPEINKALYTNTHTQLQIYELMIGIIYPVGREQITI